LFLLCVGALVEQSPVRNVVGLLGPNIEKLSYGATCGMRQP
jgi:hypothetical protein